MSSENSASFSWDIFCRVVDNFGDAGVCWRLARILHREHGLHIRLWIDDLTTLRALYPALDPVAAVQQVDGITVCRWQDATPTPDEAKVVIEAFGCGLPETYIERMATQDQPPLWIVLEYLSAEPWVDSHHGLSSPHPRLSLQRYFFFPGFSSVTGGLLREAGLLARGDAFDVSIRGAFWRDLGFDEPAPQALQVSLFAYADAPVTNLLTSMAQGSAPVVLTIPASPLLRTVREFLGVADSDQTALWRRGALEVRALPFLSQARYDELLWACDLNFVRGEDSFVRAQWAARPLVWQPYRQDDEAHQRKMEAFLARYCADLSPAAAEALRSFWQAWNGAQGREVEATWSALRKFQGVLAAHARYWRQELANLGEMSAQLVAFARNKVE